MKALFISVGDLKAKSIVDGNTDADKLLYLIEVAQDMHIQNYLGGKLYDKLQDLILSGDIDLPANSDYKTLRDDYI
jgi:RNAse (barnase) inhibitor barstar